MKYQMACEKFFWEICFVRPPSGVDWSIFGFAEFISALALLVIVYTITGIRYHFRVAVAPIPLFKLTFYLIGIIGAGTMLTDIWYAERWIVPSFLFDQPIWQGMFGSIFLSLAMMWIYYAFINPPIFSKKNYKKFTNELYRIIVKGSDNDLPIIADELIRSSKSLVKLSKQSQSRWSKDENKEDDKIKREPNASDYAYEVLLLIGNRKLCRHIIASSPITAIALFEDIARTKKYALPIGQFAKNISAEALINKDSNLYHEDEGYKSGLIGYQKPFSNSIYGNYNLVEALGSNLGSPLDIPHEIVSSWDASQLEAYARAVMLTLKNYLEGGNMHMHSYALHSAFKNIQDSCYDVYKLEDSPTDYYSTDIYKRLNVVVDFFKDAINLIEKHQNLPKIRLRVRDIQKQGDFYDEITNFMFEIICSAARVTAPPRTCWFIQYSTVWANFFDSFEDRKAWEIINFKLRRLLYNEIRDLEKFSNYQSSIILGFCLNVMGLEIGKKKKHGSNQYALRKVVLSWTKKNYMRLRGVYPDVAESCLIGNISFDEKNRRIVYTFAMEATKKYLDLS